MTHPLDPAIRVNKLERQVRDLEDEVAGLKDLEDEVAKLKQQITILKLNQNRIIENFNAHLPGHHG